ncbi:MAG TPA: amidohydrolase family protein [Xanthobacteraceae bacterium]|nr:amidohydrolase family protein [Xanthobacteraceae bacterium]
MRENHFDRRAVLASTTALAAAALMPGGASAQDTARGTAAPQSDALPARGEFVVRGAHVLTMDPNLGDLATGDVHVRDGAIAAVGVAVGAPGAEVIDGKGMICMPGFVDTHWHHWTTLLRPVMQADDPKRTYFPVTFALGLHYAPEDSYRSVRLGLAQALAAGVTTTHNWAHNVRSPAHADAEVRAMRESGLRGRFAYGPALGMANDQMMDFADIARLKKEIGSDPMLTLGINSRNVDGNLGGTRGAIDPAMAKKEWSAARELGLPITLHTSGSGAIKLLNEAGLLGPDLQLVHPLNTDAADWAALAKHDVRYSVSPLGEAGRSGEMQFPEIMQAGVKVSLSIDNVTAERCDCFACMRMLQTINRHRTGGKFKLTTRKLVEMATIDGAEDLGFADRTGSLTPGKRADLILVRTDEPHMGDIGDPYDALVQLAQPSDVDTVVVDGRILRRNGAFTALDYGKLLADAAQSVAALKTKANWS